jgi:hypothetical protein
MHIFTAFVQILKKQLIFRYIKNYFLTRTQVFSDFKKCCQNISGHNACKSLKWYIACGFK